MKRYALFGSPIDASPSPAMHNAAFSAAEMDCEYFLRPAGLDDVGQLVNEMHDQQWAGANVTTPLKVAMAQHFPLWGAAARAGAVNTIWHDGQELVGALTDVEGISTPLMEEGFKEGGVGLVIGSGGAARAAVLALEEWATEVHLAARNIEHGKALLAHLGPDLPGKVWDLSAPQTMRELLADTTVIIQATPVGSNGDAHALPWEVLPNNAVAFDLVTHSTRTPFLRDAGAVGCRTIPGWRMLLCQGIAAWKLWTGAEPNVDAMRDAVMSHLNSGRP